MANNTIPNTKNNVAVIKITLLYRLPFPTTTTKTTTTNFFIRNGTDDVQTSSSTGPTTTTTTTAQATNVTTTNSTQTPGDLSPPLPNGDDNFPHAHHQNPGHCKASFAAINQMRHNAQVCLFFYYYLFMP